MRKLAVAAMVALTATRPAMAQRDAGASDWAERAGRWHLIAVVSHQLCIGEASGHSRDLTRARLAQARALLGAAFDNMHSRVFFEVAAGIRENPREYCYNAGVSVFLLEPP